MHDSEEVCEDSNRLYRNLTACSKQGEVLDMAEVTFALHSSGLYPSAGEVQASLDQLGLQTPVRLESIPSLLKTLAGLGCRQGVCAVPHSLRGVRLRQLQSLEAAFVTSGWLSQQCQNFNTANLTAISAGTIFRMQANLYALDRFVIRPVTAADCRLWQELPSTSLRYIGLSEVAEHPCSYSEMINPEGETVDFFVSHFWGHEFCRTLVALGRCATECAAAMGKVDPQDVVFWICALSLNQHRVQEELGSSPEDAPFNVALMKAAGGVVMVLDENGEPLRRIWCIFEIHRAHTLGRPFRLQLESSRSAIHCSQSQLTELSVAVQKLSAFDAQATSVDDKLSILYRVATPGYLAGLPDFAAFRFRVNHQLINFPIDQTWFEEFDMKVRKLVATPLLEAALHEGNREMALECIGMDAVCTLSQLNVLSELGANFNNPVPCRFAGSDATAPVICLLARVGRVAEIQFLLSRGVNPDARVEILNPCTMHQTVQNRSTALTQACVHDHVAVVLALLGAKADVLAQSGYPPPLFFSCHAVQHGAEIAAALLEHQADPEGQGSTSNTAIHASAALNRMAVVELLLSRGASLHWRDGDGATPLMVAAAHGHEQMVSFMIEHGADVLAERSDQATALHRAADGGYASVVSLLLRARANAGAADGRDKTARDVAESEGHERILALFTAAKAARVMGDEPSPTRQD